MCCQKWGDSLLTGEGWATKEFIMTKGEKQIFWFMVVIILLCIVANSYIGYHWGYNECTADHKEAIEYWEGLPPEVKQTP